MKLPKLSAIVVGVNQSLTLQACIESLCDMEQVVYLDLGSTDLSCELAASCGATVASYEGPGGAGNVFNYAAALCKHEWVVRLSTDDVLEEGGADKIRQCIAAAPMHCGLSVFIREKTGTVCKMTRAFHRSCKWHGRVHEYLEAPIIVQTDITINHMRGPWHDNPTDPELNPNMLWLDMQEHPDNPRWFYYYSREWFYRKDWAKAAYWLEERVGMEGFIPEKADAYVLLARCYWELRRPDAARQACMAALAINANFQEAAMLMRDMTEGANAERWGQMATLADNRNVVFNRVTPKVKDANQG